MEISFWQQRWQENQIGFHLDHINPYLSRFWQHLDIDAGAQVLVPLCGKSLDMSWLASQGYQVLGVECNQKAVDSFFSEQAVSAQIREIKDFRVHQCDNISLLQGDFFKLDQSLLAETSAVYDRASLVALPEAMRKDYVKLLARHLPASVKMLLVTLEYDQTAMSGPPFSVTAEEVERLYSEQFTVDLLHEEDVLSEQPRFRDRGLDYLIERVYSITR